VPRIVTSVPANGIGADGPIAIHETPHPRSGRTENLDRDHGDPEQLVLDENIAGAWRWRNAEQQPSGRRWPATSR